MTDKGNFFRAVIVTGVAATSIAVWGIGLLKSPLFDPVMHREQLFVARYKKNNAPDHIVEKTLSEAYYKRYQDVKVHPYFGEKGPMGIYGAREHYLQHGQREGRVFAPLHVPDDLAFEQRLAEAYWSRYPEIAENSVWGRQGSLGVLGPRDYYLHYGRHRGHFWGVKLPDAAPVSQPPPGEH